MAPQRTRPDDGRAVRDYAECARGTAADCASAFRAALGAGSRWGKPSVSDFESRYPGYDVLDKWGSADWDQQTRRVVRERLENVPGYRFFDGDEAARLEAVIERILPQPDRAP